MFVDPAQRLSSEQEKAQYDLHRNESDDIGYRRFLARLVNPLLEELTTEAKGLDFGCGPGPTVSVLFAEQGVQVDNYDIFYANNPDVLKKRYHFITATEVVEHVFEPRQMFEQLWGMLVEGGILGMMTKQVIDRDAFARWHYKNDPTHVCFFCKETFRYLAQQFNAELEFIGDDVILLRKGEQPCNNI